MQIHVSPFHNRLPTDYIVCDVLKLLVNYVHITYALPDAQVFSMAPKLQLRSRAPPFQSYAVADLRGRAGPNGAPWFRTVEKHEVSSHEVTRGVPLSEGWLLRLLNGLTAFRLVVEKYVQPL